VTDYLISPPGRELRLQVKFNMSSDEKEFHLTETRQLYEDENLVREKTWTKDIPRDNQ
jgi:hypothetical protein